MATTYIPIDTAKRLGGQLRSAIDQAKAAQDALAKLKAIMDTQVNGADYSLVEGQFGLQATQGASVYNLVAGTTADLVASKNFAQLVSWCG